jgi:predicted nucleotidyltransferase
MADRSSDAQLIEKIIEFLMPIGVSRIAVFGSFARGDAREDSDVDVLVRFKGPSQRKQLGFRWFSLSDELSQFVGRRADVISEGGLSPRFRQAIERDLKVIYDEAG